MKVKWIVVVAMVVALPVGASLVTNFVHTPISVSGHIHLNKPNVHIGIIAFVEEYAGVYQYANFTQTDYHIVLPDSRHIWDITVGLAPGGTCSAKFDPSKYSGGSNNATYDFDC